MNANGKYTPGPWRAVDCRHQKNGQIRLFPDGKRADTREYGQIANVLAGGPNPAADAVLIAVAPRMLDVLREIADWLDGIADNAEDASKTQRDACALLDVVRGTIERATGGAV